MLSDIVDRAVTRRSQWCSPTLTLDDLRQEGWVAVLEAQEAGVTDPKELLRWAELHLKGVIRTENRRREVPVGLLFEDEEDD